MNNPMDMLKMAMGKMSPKEMVMKMAKNNTNPIMGNLIDMMEKGDNQGIENFARNVCREKGIDFDKDFKDFMGYFK